MDNSTKLELSFTTDGFIDYSPWVGRITHDYKPFWFEVFDWKYWAERCNRNYYYPIYISAAYILIIFSLQTLMRNRKPFHLKRELALWNGALGVFSILGFVRLFPEFWTRFNRENGGYLTLCQRDYMSMPAAFWGTMFIGSKVVELGDTLFIVLRKKPLQFLQWYHHAMSLTLAWTTGPYLEPICVVYILMNYGVHSMMYPYFSLRAMDVHIPRKLANIITFLQLAQMLTGVYINGYTSYLYYFSNSCDRHPFSIKMIWAAYGSFAILFGELFYRLVLAKKSRGKKEE